MPLVSRLLQRSMPRKSANRPPVPWAPDAAALHRANYAGRRRLATGGLRDPAQGLTVPPRSRKAAMRQVLLYDTTLRDGMQGQGMSLSAQEKVRVVSKLDELGVHFIEAGFPGSNPKELELFEMLAGLELRQAAVCAFGMTRRPGTPAAGGQGLRAGRGGVPPGANPGGQTRGPRPPKGEKGEGGGRAGE